MALMMGSRIGSYEIVAPLGAGGMGEVYRARDTKLDRHVAIKILPESFAADPERVARFQREAKALASLKFPYAVTENGQRFLITKPVDEPSTTPITLVVNWPAALKK